MSKGLHETVANQTGGNKHILSITTASGYVFKERDGPMIDGVDKAGEMQTPRVFSDFQSPCEMTRKPLWYNPHAMSLIGHSYENTAACTHARTQTHARAHGFHLPCAAKQQSKQIVRNQKKMDQDRQIPRTSQTSHTYQRNIVHAMANY